MFGFGPHQNFAKRQFQRDGGTSRIVVLDLHSPIGNLHPDLVAFDHNNRLGSALWPSLDE